MKPISISQAVVLLNEALKLDPVAINNLFSIRVLCNAAIVKHKTIQAGVTADKNTIGVMGIINGIFGSSVHGQGYIGYKFEGGKIVEFIKCL